MFSLNTDNSIEIPLSYFGKRNFHFYPPALPQGTLVLFGGGGGGNYKYEEETNDAITEEKQWIFVKTLLEKLGRKFYLDYELNIIHDFSENNNNIISTIPINNSSYEISPLFFCINSLENFLEPVPQKESLEDWVSRIIVNTHKIIDEIDKIFKT